MIARLYELVKVPMEPEPMKATEPTELSQPEDTVAPEETTTPTVPVDPISPYTGDDRGLIPYAIRKPLASRN